jgi:Integrase core domain
MPDTARPVNRHPPDSSRDSIEAPVSMSLGLTTRHQWFTYVRLLGPHLPPSRRLFHDAHHHGSFTAAARGGLTPAPACRCRRTYLHLHNSTTTARFRFYIETSQSSSGHTNALAETTIGLYKTEAVGRNSPFLTGPLKTIDDVEYATMEWVDWYNARRLHSLLDYVPPDEYESAYYAQPQASQPATSQQ